MNDVPNWVFSLVTIIFSMIGGIGGSFIGVRLSMAKLEEWRLSVERWQGTVDSEMLRLRNAVHAQANAAQRQEGAVETLTRLMTDAILKVAK